MGVALSASLLTTRNAGRGTEAASGRGVLFYDAACGFCRWCVAKILAWDRDRLIVPLAIKSPESALLLANVEPDRRFASWHFRDPSGTVFSAGAAFAPLLRLLPGGSLLRWPRAFQAEPSALIVLSPATEACSGFSSAVVPEGGRTDFSQPTNRQRPHVSSRKLRSLARWRRLVLRLAEVLPELLPA